MLLACKAVTLPIHHLLPNSTPTASAPSPTPLASATLIPYPIPTIAAKTPTVIPKETLSVIFHPDSALYVGDQISLEIIAPTGENLQDSQVEVSVAQPISHTLKTTKFAHFGLGNRLEANLTWAWNTTELSPGDYTLSFSVQPNGATWTQTVLLQPAEALPLNEVGARWVTDESDCCLVYYITQTASERDISTLLEMLDKQAREISQEMQAEFNAPVSVVFIPRVLGHGGFTTQEIAVTYLDRNYIGDATEMILRHELAHLLDGQLGGDLRPTLLVEGLAVYISGGHFKPELLMPRAAVLVDNHQYIPFDDLIDDFYNTPHEIGYMEAGALVEFMVETWGWEDFSSFYRDIHPAPDEGRQSVAMDIALQKHFNLSLKALEQRFLEALVSQSISSESKDDVRLTVDYYNTVRRYQQSLDPSAYFLTAWILDGKDMRQRSITADYMRHPSTVNNLVLETMLQAAGDSLRNTNYSEAEHLISAVNLVLDALGRDESISFSGSSLALDYYAIVNTLLARGYQPQHINVNANTAHTWAILTGQQLREFVFVRDGSLWELK